MRSCIKEMKGRIEFTTEFEGKTANDVRLQMDLIMANRGEGLVMKHPDSEYVLNGRNKDWIKVSFIQIKHGATRLPGLRQVKPEYMVCSTITVGEVHGLRGVRTTWAKRWTF